MTSGTEDKGSKAQAQYLSEIKLQCVYGINTFEDLTVEELANICLGHHEGGLSEIVGSSCKHVLGGAGETTLSVSEIKDSLTMADGPAGLRLKAEYGIDKETGCKALESPPSFQ